MIDITHFHNSVWLAEPNRFQRAIAKVRAHQRCFTREEILAQHKADLQRAKALATEAMPSQITDPSDPRLKDEFKEWSLYAGDVKLDAPPIRTKLEAPKAIRAIASGKKVGVIGVYGPTQQHTTSELLKAGGTSLDFVSAAFSRLMDDPAIGAIVLHMDTPGGESFGVQELSDKIHAARGAKPSYMMADSMACSAGQWYGSACSMCCCTPGGIVGSVGVFVLHVDQSKMLEEEGIKVTLISAGKYKTELNPFEPLSEDAQANQQRYVDSLYRDFVAALARNRGTTVDDVRKSYGQGRVMMADEAAASGLIDRVLTMEELISKLTGGEPAKVQSGRPSAEMLRMRHEHEIANG